MRKTPTLKEKLAACLIELMEIDREDAKKMTPEQILSLVEWDHYPVAFNIARDSGWTIEEINHPTNLLPRFILGHREKTAKVDTPVAAKSKRLTAAQEEHRRRMLIVTEGEPDDLAVVKSKWPSRPFPQHQNPWGKK